jgi:hypothetical protein
MCNLYSNTLPAAEMRQIFTVDGAHDTLESRTVVGHLPQGPGADRRDRCRRRMMVAECASGFRDAAGFEEGGNADPARAS